MNPIISEFSYGYAVTENIIDLLPLKVSAAPTFPSLREEGQNGGYDLKLDFDGLFLFLQFKLSHKMVRYTSFEARQGLFTPPHYRFYLRSSKYSEQHKMLLELECSGEHVFYISPCFFELEEFNRLYLEGSIIENSVFVSPMEIGLLPDDDIHHISFKPREPAYLCSEPKKISVSMGNKNILSRITEIFEQQKRQYNRQIIEEIAANIRKVVYKNYKTNDFFSEPLNLNKLNDLNPLRQIGYLSRNFLNCEFFILHNE